MFAVLGHAEIDAGRVDEAQAILEDRLLPQVKQMPGFVSGTWVRDGDNSRGRSMVLFEDEASALGAAEQARGMAPPDGAPIKFRGFDVVEVVAQI